ncbi:MAG: hypothetical protein GPI97_12405 [Microcystis aeruginosa W13-16]|nr:hypothetical protein [Microcystis aeruginosa W13-16]
MKPFKKQELKKPSIFDKIFKRKLFGNIALEIRNYLADVDSPPFDRKKYGEIINKYNGLIPPKHLSDITDIYKEYFKYCIEDQHLEDSEVESLRELKLFLQLRDKQVEIIENEHKSAIYKKELKKALEDGNLNEQESEFLEKLKSNLRIPEAISKKLYESSARDILNNALNKAISDGRLSPDEEKELLYLSENIGLQYTEVIQSNKNLDYYRYIWLLENGDIPSLEVDIKLQSDEECYFYQSCTWNELRKTTKIVNYGGIHLNYKIVKGINIKLGSAAIFPISSEEYKLIDTGILYITNKRLIFMGPSGNKTINYKKILDIRLFPNEILIEKDSGKSPLLIFDENFEILTIILRRLLSQ